MILKIILADCIVCIQISASMTLCFYGNNYPQKSGQVGVVLDFLLFSAQRILLISLVFKWFFHKASFVIRKPKLAGQVEPFAEIFKFTAKAGCPGQLPSWLHLRSPILTVGAPSGLVDKKGTILRMLLTNFKMQQVVSEEESNSLHRSFGHMIQVYPLIPIPISVECPLAVSLHSKQRRKRRKEGNRDEKTSKRVGRKQGNRKKGKKEEEEKQTLYNSQSRNYPHIHQELNWKFITLYP